MFVYPTCGRCETRDKTYSVSLKRRATIEFLSANDCKPIEKYTRARPVVYGDDEYIMDTVNVRHESRIYVFAYQGTCNSGFRETPKGLVNLRGKAY